MTIGLEENWPLHKAAQLAHYLRAFCDTSILGPAYVAIGNGRVADVTLGSDHSCAVSASALVLLAGLTRGGLHSTVPALEEDLRCSGWTVFRRNGLPEPLSVLVWPEKVSDADGKLHGHVGYYLGKDIEGQGVALSWIAKARSLMRHHWTFGETSGQPRRAPERVYELPAHAWACGTYLGEPSRLASFGPDPNAIDPQYVTAVASLVDAMVDRKSYYAWDGISL